MRRLSIIMSIVCVAVFIGFVAMADAYEWHVYKGHLYTLTKDWSNWADAEQEAVSLGGHLVTINDNEENTWLTNTFKDTYVRSYPGDPWQNIAWIGYYYDASSGSWKWISGEPVTYHNYYPAWPMGGIFAYLHLAYHPFLGTWNAYYMETTAYGNPKGIIEVIPKPLTVLIDIKPNKFPNSINLRFGGIISVAILSDSIFDATTVAKCTVIFAGASPLTMGPTHKDVNGDGLFDIVLDFKTRDMNLQLGDQEACLTGETLDGQLFKGCDSVRIVK